MVAVVAMAGVAAMEVTVVAGTVAVAVMADVAAMEVTQVSRAKMANTVSPANTVSSSGRRLPVLCPSGRSQPN
jgi:hypothetical protein